MKKQKILLLMCNWIGDTFWGVQVIPAMKAQYPNAEIWTGIKPYSKDLLCGLIDEDKTIVLKSVISDRRRERFSLMQYLSEIKRAKKEKFDLAIYRACSRINCGNICDTSCSWLRTCDGSNRIRQCSFCKY